MGETSGRTGLGRNVGKQLVPTKSTHSTYASAQRTIGFVFNIPELRCSEGWGLGCGRVRARVWFGWVIGRIRFMV